MVSTSYPPRGDTTDARIRAYLNSPTLLTRAIQPLTSDRFFADRILRGRATSRDGAVHYNQNQPSLPDRSSRAIEPMARYPMSNIGLGVPLVAPIEKLGIKHNIALEAVKWLGFNPVAQGQVVLANGVSDDFDTYAMGVINSVAVPTITGSDWNTATAKTIIRQILAAQAAVNENAGGFRATTLLVDALDAAAIYADEVVLRGLQSLPQPLEIVTAPTGTGGGNPMIFDADLFGSIVTDATVEPVPGITYGDDNGVRVMTQYFLDGPDGSEYYSLFAKRYATAIVQNVGAAVRITGTG